MAPHVQGHRRIRSRYPNISPRCHYRITKSSEVLQVALKAKSIPRSSRSAMSPSGNNSTPIQSRRSHTKSRKGCKTCKKRHIRCDETSPQCRNCTKHNVTCDYMDGILVKGSPDLSMTPQIQCELDTWRATGVYPFPTLGIDNHLSPLRYSPTELRLIHHISSVAAQMQATEGASAIWTKRVPMFMRIASNNDFVMHSLLGLSASHLSWKTANEATLQLAYQHRGYAFQGLQNSIGNFSKENSDAVLAASILLSWQVTDWRSWASLLQGTSTVIDAMQSWKHESEFAEFMEEKEVFTRGPLRPQIADPERDRHVVSHVYHRLLPLVEFCGGRDQELAALLELIDFVQGLYKLIPAESADVQFAYLHPLRTWLFFLPIDFLKRGQQDPSVMLLLAQFYGVALAVEPLFPAVGAAYFGTMSVGPIEQIHRTLTKHASQSADAQRALGFMEFPLEMVRHFKERISWRRFAPIVGVSALTAVAAAAASSPTSATTRSPTSPASPTATTATATPTTPVNMVIPAGNILIPKSVLECSHQQLGGWNFNAFPEYTMVRSGSGVPGYPMAGVIAGSIAEDVHGSIAASDFIASTMLRRSP